MDDRSSNTLTQPSAGQELDYVRHQCTNRLTVRRIPYLLEFAAARLKAQMLGGQAKTIAQGGYESVDHER
jgi:hypothetical protein